MWFCLLTTALAAEPEPVADAALAVVPFGVAQFVWHKPVPGLVYALTQAGGVGVAVWASTEAAAAEDAGDDAALEQWQTVTGVAVGAAALSYAIELIDGSKLAEQRARQAADAGARREAVERFDMGVALAAGRSR